MTQRYPQVNLFVFTLEPIAMQLGIEDPADWAKLRRWFGGHNYFGSYSLDGAVESVIAAAVDTGVLAPGSVPAA